MTGSRRHTWKTGDREVSDDLDGPEEYEPTGNTVVDEVVASLEQVEDAPVSERVAAFEAAQEKLRGALADADNDKPGS